jgi:hypothetical protein
MSPLRVCALGSLAPRACAEGTGSAEGSPSPKHTGSSFHFARAQGSGAAGLNPDLIADRPLRSGAPPFVGVECCPDVTIADGPWAQAGNMTANVDSVVAMARNSFTRGCMIGFPEVSLIGSARGLVQSDREGGGGNRIPPCGAYASQEACSTRWLRPFRARLRREKILAIADEALTRARRSQCLPNGQSDTGRK